MGYRASGDGWDPQLGRSRTPTAPRRRAALAAVGASAGLGGSGETASETRYLPGLDIAGRDRQGRRSAAAAAGEHRARCSPRVADRVRQHHARAKTLSFWGWYDPDVTGHIGATLAVV